MTRNLVSISVPASLLAELVTQTAWMDADGTPTPFPADTRYARAYYDPETDSLVIMLEHPSFPPTREGAIVQRVRAVMGRALLEKP